MNVTMKENTPSEVVIENRNIEVVKLLLLIKRLNIGVGKVKIVHQKLNIKMDILKWRNIN